MSYADEIRDYCIKRYVEPARASGAREVRIQVGDVHRDMGLKNRLPAVVSALGSTTFEDQARADRKDVLGPLNSTTTVFIFQLR